MTMQPIETKSKKKRTLKAVAKALKPSIYVPSTDDPKEEIRKIMLQHHAATKASVGLKHMSTDRKNEETGEVIKCRLPEDTALVLQEAGKRAKADANALKTPIRRELRKLPIYTEFLKDVFGFGEVVSGYIASDIDFHKCVKPSQLKRFCGMAVINGKLERRTKGQKNAYNANMRTRLFQAFSAMWKNAAKEGVTTKYLEIWRNTKHRELSRPEVINGKVERNGKMVSAKGIAHKKGWHKACDVFLEDLYMMGRALEGLEVWPSYYAAKLGYEHGGKISVNAPKRLTVDEAKELIGFVGGQPVAHPVVDEGEHDEVFGDEDDDD